MIQDLDGATSEPSRRRHVATVSASVAAAALVLLLALFSPPALVATPPQSASPGPSAARMTVLSALDSTTRITYDEALRNDMTSTQCAAGIGSSPPVHLVIDGSGRAVAAYTSGTTGRFIPLPRVYVGSGWLTVPCDTSDVFAPRLNRAR